MSMLSSSVDRRTVLRAGVAGLAGTTILGLSSCSNSGKASSENSSSKAIKWFGNPSTLGKNPYEPMLVEKTFGVKLTTYSVTSGDYVSKLQSLLVSNDIPDVMLINDPDIFQKYAAQGVLAVVPKDTIARHAPHLYADMNKNWKVGWYYSLYNGENYGYATSYPGGVHSSVTEWRTDLLHKAGVDKVPDTLDEVEAAFAALKKIGVYGMSTTGQSYYAQFMTIFGAFGVMPLAWKRSDSGDVINGTVAPEAKEALALLASWYKKGYIDTEFISSQAGAQTQKFAAGKVAMWDYGNAADADPANPNSALAAARKNDRDAQVTLAYPPQGPGGRGSWAWGPAGWTVAFGKQLEDDPAKLKKVLSILDGIDGNQALGMKTAMGEEGTMYTLTDASKGLAGGWQWKAPYTDPTKLSAAGIGVSAAVGQASWAVASDATFNDPKLRALAAKYGRYGVYDLFGKAGSVPGSGQYLANLESLKIKSYAQIVTGASPISAFDDFVKQWNAGGGEELHKAANKLYGQAN